MKDIAWPRRSPFRTFREGLTKKHSMVFNILIILSILSLAIAGAFLASDIMSFKSNAAQKGTLGSIYLAIPKGIQATLQTCREKQVNLTDQLKSIMGMRSSVKAAGQEVDKEKAQALLAKNKLATSNIPQAGTQGSNQSQAAFPDSSRNLTTENRTTVRPLQTTRTIIWDDGSGGDSGGDYAPIRSAGDRSGKVNQSNKNASEEKAKYESQNSVVQNSNISLIKLAPSSNSLSASSANGATSIITPRAKSPKEHLDLVTKEKIVLATNNSSQLQKPGRNQTPKKKQTKSKFKSQKQKKKSSSNTSAKSQRSIKARQAA
jgi:hypothetical protein